MINKLEIGKCYELDSSFPYWCVNIQKEVIFKSPLIVKFTNEIYCGDGGFGEIVEVSQGVFGKDLQTKTEIEFSLSDVIKEYKFNSDGDRLILCYMDFPYVGNNNTKKEEK